VLRVHGRVLVVAGPGDERSGPHASTDCDLTSPPTPGVEVLS